MSAPDVLGAGFPLETSILVDSWDLMNIANQYTTGTMPAFPAPKIVDGRLRTSVRLVDFFQPATVICVINSKPRSIFRNSWAISVLAIQTPAGGDGQVSDPYLFVGGIYLNMFKFVAPEVVNGLESIGLGDPQAPRTGLDLTFSTASLVFHFVGTPDHGDWLVVTAESQ